MAKKNVDVMSEWSDLQSKVANSFASPVRGEVGAARFASEWSNGVACIVIKPLHWSDNEFYEIGDEFLPNEDHITRALKLAVHGWFIPRAEWNATKKHAVLQDIKNKAQPFAARIDRYDRELIGKKAEHATALMTVKKTKDDIATLQSQRQHAVDELGDILSGAKVV